MSRARVHLAIESVATMPRKQTRRSQAPEDQLRYLASPHGSLFYEALMMQEAAARCVEPTGKRSLQKDVPYNMAIECFLVHFRNLRDFLYPDDKVQAESDNVVAFDYDSNWAKTDKDWKDCSSDERRRINKLLAHISYSRRELAHRWPINDMRQRIMQRLAAFIRCLPASRQEWFKNWDLEKAIGGMS